MDETPAEPAIPLQPAQIWAHKAGFSDRTVNLFMASSRPSGEEARRADPAKTVLPDQPYHLDLVLEAASGATARPLDAADGKVPTEAKPPGATGDGLRLNVDIRPERPKAGDTVSPGHARTQPARTGG